MSKRPSAYQACRECSAKWFAPVQVERCPRCGSKRLLGAVASKPWQRRQHDNESKVARMSQPLHEVRVGTIKASVWRRSPASPCSVGITRLYRDGRQWKESSRFAHEDLPAIRLALDLAYEWLFELAQAEAPALASPEQAVETPAPASPSACNHTHHALNDDGRPTGSWTVDSAGGKPRVVCGVCGKFYGFLPPSKRDQAMQHAYQLQQQRLSCPGCGETPFLG